jgi:Putative Actinobacterial Holin-X, holin superfamily III
LITAAVWAVIGVVLGLLGRTRLQRVRGMDRTTDTVKKIPDALKGHEENNR